MHDRTGMYRNRERDSNHIIQIDRTIAPSHHHTITKREERRKRGTKRERESE